MNKTQASCVLFDKPKKPDGSKAKLFLVEPFIYSLFEYDLMHVIISISRIIKRRVSGFEPIRKKTR